MLVVVSAPGGDQDTSLLQARKPVVIQTLIPEASIEALDERVLRGFASLNQLELNTMLAGPLVKRLAGITPAPGRFESSWGNPGSEPPGRGRASRNILKFRSRPRGRWPPC